MPPDTLIDGVSDTARWVAMYRAIESERPDAIFRDPFARRLAGPKGEAIVNAMQKGRDMSWPMVVRTSVLDDIIMREIGDGVDTVLNLAAGLDVRAYRMPLPSALRWIDVDQPHMVAYKSEAMANETPVCRYESVPLDLIDVAARQALFTRVGAASRRTLVITEGLLIYLADADVIALARDLHAQPTFRRWAADLGSPGLLKLMAKSWGRAVAEGGAPFLFGPAEGPAFFAPYGWKSIAYHGFVDEGIRLKRVMAMARFWRFIGRLMSKERQEEFRYFSGVMLLERS